MADIDSDCDIIAINKLLDIDEYRLSNLNPTAKAWEPLYLQAWKEFVRQNSDAFYDWVIHLPAALIIIKGLKHITDKKNFKWDGEKITRRHFRQLLNRAAVTDHRSRKECPADHRFIQGDYAISVDSRRDKHLIYDIPALRKLVSRVRDKDVYDVWYGMDLTERNSVTWFLRSIGVTWVDEHLV